MRYGKLIINWLQDSGNLLHFNIPFLRVITISLDRKNWKTVTNCHAWMTKHVFCNSFHFDWFTSCHCTVIMHCSNGFKINVIYWMITVGSNTFGNYLFRKDPGVNLCNLCKVFSLEQHHVSLYLLCLSDFTDLGSRFSLIDAQRCCCRPVKVCCMWI